jgi:peptidoglycan L-alanyl-D-glutamate endopeptidase CwlK
MPENLIPGRASRSPEDLCPCIRAKFHQLVETALIDGIATRCIETLRDDKRQAHYLAIGASQTRKSQHLPQPPFGLSLAFDLAPIDYLIRKNWYPVGVFWLHLARIGKELGLHWGGDWEGFRDQPHFYLKKCQCPKPEEISVA